MSPRYLGGKYHSRLPPPQVAKMHVIVFAGDRACEIELYQTGVICFPWRQQSGSCGMFESWISDAHCPFQWKWQVLHNYDISVLQQVSMFFDGIAYLMKVWPLFMREFPRVPMTWQSTHARISNVTSQMLAKRSALISGASNVFLVNVINHIVKRRGNSSWYIWSDCLVQPIFNQNPLAAYFEQFTAPCYSLWITGSSLWHRDYPWTCCGLVSTVFSRKI